MHRILLVDHVIEPRNALAGLLSALDYKVDCANSGREGIELLDKSSVDLIILNLVPSRIDGWQLLQWVQADIVKVKAPIIIHSLLDSDQWQLANQLGAKELWIRGKCTFASICDSLERHFEIGRTANAA